MPADQVAAKQKIGFLSEDLRLYGAATLAWHMAFIASIYPDWNQAYADTLLRRFDLKPQQKIKGLSHWGSASKPPSFSRSPTSRVCSFSTIRKRETKEPVRARPEQGELEEDSKMPMSAYYMNKTFTEIKRHIMVLNSDFREENFKISHIQPVELSLEQLTLYSWAYVWNKSILETHSWFIAWGIRLQNGYWEKELSPSSNLPHAFVELGNVLTPPKTGCRSTDLKGSLLANGDRPRRGGNWRPQTNDLVWPKRKVRRVIRRPSDRKRRKSDYLRRRPPFSTVVCHRPCRAITHGGSRCGFLLETCPSLPCSGVWLAKEMRATGTGRGAHGRKGF